MESKTIVIKPVSKAKFSGLSAYSKSRYSITGAQLGSDGLYKTGLTTEEEKEFAEQLGLPVGTLSKHNEAFWSSVLRLGLPQDKPYTLHINSPMDEIKYRVLINRSDIASNEMELIKNPNAMFYIEDKESKAKVEEVAMNYLFEATEIFMNMTAEDRRGYLRLYNRKGVEDVSDSVVKTDLFKYINKDPKQFLEYNRNPDIDIRIKIEDMLDKGLLKKKGSFYHYQDEVIGNSLDACVSFFKDLRNQSIKLAAEHDLRVAKKKGK
jgi:hypothetical protein